MHHAIFSARIRQRRTFKDYTESFHFRMENSQASGSTTTRNADGLDFTATSGKRQGREAPQSLWVKPGAKHLVWKTQ